MLQQRDLQSLIKSQQTKRTRMLQVGLAILTVVGVGTGGWFGWTSYQQQMHKSDLSKNIGHVRRGSVNIRVQATGTIRPFNQVKLSPKFTGLLKELYVQQGDRVKAGQLVALMDDSNIKGQLAAARAAYESAKATYEKNLHGSRPQELADSEAQLRKGEAAVRFAQMAVNHTKADLVAAKAQAQRDVMNAKRFSLLSKQGAISDQDALNAQTAADVSEAQLQRTQQDLKQAEAALVQAKADFESVHERYLMVKEGFRQEDIKAAQGAMLQAKGNLDYVLSQLEDCHIRAPFDGVITQKYTDNGAIVTPTTASTTNSATSSSIVSLAGRLEMVASVAETDIDNIHQGQTVLITASSYPTRVFHGKVTLIAPEAIVTQNVTSFEVHTTIDDDPDHRMMSGMNVNAEFLAGSRDNVLLIPTSCVVTRRAKTGVFVPDSSGNPQFRPVKIGTTSDTETIVSSGLKEGDPIFVSLTKEQLIEQGYTEKSILTPPSSKSAQGAKNKL